MGVELYITRAEFWADHTGKEIKAKEWLEYVASDPELQLDTQHGKYFVRWMGKSKYDEPWLDWSRGNISTKWPDTALYQKMLKIAKALDAHIQDDDGNLYEKAADWEFEPD
jgi:hypothetical protein